MNHAATEVPPDTNEGDHNVAGRDQQTGGGGGNVGGSGEVGVIAFFFSMGPMMEPMAEAAAVPEPEIAPNSMLAITLVCARRQGRGR